MSYQLETLFEQMVAYRKAAGIPEPEAGTPVDYCKVR